MYRKASFVRTKSVGELSDGISDEVTADADSGVDSIMQPLYRLIFEVFELTGIFKWLPRTLVSLVQVTYGKSISRYLPCLRLSILHCLDDRCTVHSARRRRRKKKFISSRPVQYRHTKCIQTPNIYNCLPEAARELYKLSMLATYNT